MKTVEELSPEEFKNYIALYFATADVQASGKSRAVALSRLAIDPEEQSEFSIVQLEATRNLEVLKNKRRAFMKGAAGIIPPTQENFSSVKASALEIAKIKSGNEAARRILDLITNVIEEFSSVQSSP
jgi:hypothetical protein